jgi:hypothetical protein
VNGWSYSLTEGNSELRASSTRIFTWSLPALNARVDEKNVVTCPNAGACAKLCYARSGTYRFSNVLEAHTRNLARVLRSLSDWKAELVDELRMPRYRGGVAVRIHDSGDFFSADYFDAWVRIATLTPDVLFYAYTKEVALVKSRRLPKNLVIIFSMGGKQDHLVDKDTDRHADVFPTLEALEAAGYVDQSDDDLLAATLETTRIGIVANNIPHLRKQQGDATFAGLQVRLSEKVSHRRNVTQ